MLLGFCEDGMLLGFCEDGMLLGFCEDGMLLGFCEDGMLLGFCEDGMLLGICEDGKPLWLLVGKLLIYEDGMLLPVLVGNSDELLPVGNWLLEPNCELSNWLEERLEEGRKELLPWVEPAVDDEKSLDIAVSPLSKADESTLEDYVGNWVVIDPELEGKLLDCIVDEGKLVYPLVVEPDGNWV